MKLFLALTWGYLCFFSWSNCKPTSPAGSINEEAGPTNAELNNDTLTGGDYCFLKTENKDTTVIRLRILSDDDIRGEMSWLPAEGHGAYGTLTGKLISPNEMELKYNYTIEGSEQSEIKILKIDGAKLMVKIGALIDPLNDGNLIYEDASKAAYTDIYDKISCEN